MPTRRKALVAVKRLWSMRARCYDHLRWARDGGYLRAFIQAGRFKDADIVLDVGTGTGIVAHALAPRVRQVVGIDISLAMLRLARKRRDAKVIFRCADAARLSLPDNYFDKITARMVFHHLDGVLQEATNECWRVLKPKGAMVLSEGVPPHRCLEDWYTRMFALKEKRITFFKEDLVDLMKTAGFKIVRVMAYLAPRMSIKNWLKHSATARHNQKKILQMHFDLDTRGKRLYNLRVGKNDIFVDFKYVIVVGQKR